MKVLQRYTKELVSEDGPCQITIALQEATRQGTATTKVSVTTLISESSDHPGAGSYTVDDAVSSYQVDCLLELFNCLPVDTSQKKKYGSLCSERSYYCDSEGYMRAILESVVLEAGLVSDADDVKAFSYMRFLHYSRAGSILAPHVDLCRVDPFSNHRSTHTFILYFTDC